jgi:hypothetical protein
LSGPLGIAPTVSGEVGFDHEDSVFCHTPKVAKNIVTGLRGADIG